MPLVESCSSARGGIVAEGWRGVKQESWGASLLCAHAEHVWVEDLAVQVVEGRLAVSMFLGMEVLGLQPGLHDIHVGRNSRNTGSVLAFPSATWRNTTKILTASKGSLCICEARSDF